MQWLQTLQRLFSLDTLDTRFTTSSKTPPRKATDSIATEKPSVQQPLGRPGESVEAESLPGAQASRWQTPEFYFYYLCFLTIPPLMFKAVYDVSQPSHPNYSRFEGLLDPGWIPGRRVDNSDAQYASFRDNIPYMALLLVLHPLLRKAYNSIVNPTGFQVSKQNSNGLTQGLPPHVAADARLEQRVKFDLAFVTIFLLALHGLSAFKVFTILYANYKLTTSLPKRYIPASAWIFNIGILFANELGHGYQLGPMVSAFLPAATTAAGGQNTNWGFLLDSYGGLIPRWEILFNITVLRLISFDLDYYWACDRRVSSPIEVCPRIASQFTR